LKNEDGSNFAKYSYSSNSKYVSMKCKIMNCTAALSYGINTLTREDGEVIKELRVKKFRN
jgi:hypothetical protein